MHPIESALFHAINEHPQMPLVIAYSGGVDSQVLLHAFASLNQQNAISNLITVCHVNHGLSENAHEWDRFAEKSCIQLNLPLKICHVNVQAQAQQSLESLARDARYQALHAIYDQPSLIITGHHRDDQAETFLLALKRGSGLKGLSAMASKTKQANDFLLRPLLNVSRADIVDYANNHGLTWVEDESNKDTRFDRNFIRNDIMPLLTKRWPSITTTINRSSEHCREGQLLLNELAADDLKDCQCKHKGLIVDRLSLLTKKRFNNLIRYFLTKNNCLMPSTEQLTQLHKQLNADSDKNPAVKVGNNFLRRYQGVLYLTADFDDVSLWHKDLSHLYNNVNEIDSTVVLPDNLGQLNFSNETLNNVNKVIIRITKPSAGQKVSVRFNHNNPKCLPDYRQQSRPLKKVLQELNIPPWERKRIPFIYYDDILVAAIGYFICQNFLPQQNSEIIGIIWTR